MVKRIYVGNLSYNTTEAELKTHFEKVGAVNSVAIIKDRETDRSKGFAFVEMENGDQAISELNDAELGGRKLRVSEARKKNG